MKTASKGFIPIVACALVLGALPAMAQPSPQADISVQLTGPGSTPKLDDVFDLHHAVKNKGPASAAASELNAFLGSGLTFISAASSDASDVCEYVEYPAPQPLREGSSTYENQGGVSCKLGTLASGDEAAVTITVKRSNANEASASASIYSETNDEVYENNYADLYLEADTSEPSDLSIVASGPNEAETGSRFTYELNVTNAGPFGARDVSVFDQLPMGTEFVSVAPSDSCTVNGGGYSEGPNKPIWEGYAEIVCHLGDLASGASSKISIVVDRTDPHELYNGASVYGASYDPNQENNWSSVSTASDRDKLADAYLSMSAPKSPAVGSQFDIDLSVGNGGPARADDVRAHISLGDGLQVIGSSSDGCAPQDFGPDPIPPEPDGGGGSTEPGGGTSEPYPGSNEWVCTFGSLSEGAQRSVALTVERTSAWELWANAWVSTSSFDENYENDYAYLHIPADESVTSDIAVTAPKIATNALVGETFDIVMDVANNGPATAGDVFFSNYLNDGLSFVSVTSSDESDSCTFDGYPGKDPVAYDGQPAPAAPDGSAGSDETATSPYWNQGGVNCDLGTMATGQSSTITITVTRTHAREIWNSGWAYSSNYEPFYENNYAEVMLEPDRSHPADIGVEMSAPSVKPEVGESFTFGMRVYNNGPERADNVTLTDYLPEGIDFESVSNEGCAFTQGYPPPYAEGPEKDAPFYWEPKELRCDLGSLESGADVSFDVVVTRTSEYELWNSAWVSTSNYDENYENDYASAQVDGKRWGGWCLPGGEPEEIAQDDQVKDCADGSACGTAGDDHIVVDACPVMAGPGSDYVEVDGSEKTRDVRVDAGRGDDNIDLTLGPDSAKVRKITLLGGVGSDHFVIRAEPGVTARVVIRGGGGNDTVDIDAPAGTHELVILFEGGRGNDIVRTLGGTYDVWSALELRGGRGQDSLLGGHGNDAIYGGLGRDVLDGAWGNDLMHGGDGRDTCREGPGRDRFRSC